MTDPRRLEERLRGARFLVTDLEARVDRLTREAQRWDANHWERHPDDAKAVAASCWEDVARERRILDGRRATLAELEAEVSR